MESSEGEAVPKGSEAQQYKLESGPGQDTAKPASAADKLNQDRLKFMQENTEQVMLVSPIAFQLNQSNPIDNGTTTKV